MKTQQLFKTDLFEYRHWLELHFIVFL